MWKRRKDLLYLGSVHGGELSEMYGTQGDYLAADAVSTLVSLSFYMISTIHEHHTSVNFINRQDPNYPKGSTTTSLLSSIAWPKYTLDTEEMFLFSDNPAEEYTTIPDDYRADAIAAIIELQMAFGD